MASYSPKEGDVILLPVGQDGKWRPALCLREMPPNYQEFLVCGLSTQLGLYIKGFDEIVKPSDDNLRRLQGESVIRLGFLDRVRIQEMTGSIGFISKERHRRLLERLSNYLVQDISSK